MTEHTGQAAPSHCGTRPPPRLSETLVALVQPDDALAGALTGWRPT